ncbi:MAG: type II and III secretion system protein family protein [Phycisphaerales bacterium]|nr:MAG: type II and III secretion system protein family protein [Phycisphaerales bacterium]
MDDQTGNGFPRWGAIVAFTAGSLILPPVSSGQAPPGEAGDFTASISQVSADTSVVTVSIGKSVLIDLSKPINRASIAAEDVATVVVLSPMQIMVTGKGFGSTQLVVWTEEGEQKIFDIMVQIEIPQLIGIIRRAAPGSDVDVEVVHNTVVLLGDVPSGEVADRITQVAGIFSGNVVNHLRVRGEQQVLLRCTVAEVSRQAMRQLGFNGFMAGDDFRDFFFFSNVNGINPTSIIPAEDVLATATIPFLTGPSGISPATTFSIGFPRVQMQLFVQALRDNGLLKVLAEPNLVAISGQTATFLAGGEYPVPVPQDQNTITIEYREFGVRLNFTPVVLGRNIVRLRVAPEVSALDFSNAVQFAGFVVPGLTKRNAETTVELGNGQTLAIAGLLSEQVRAASSKIPGIGDIPVIGQLFGSVEYQQETTELVILVSPEVVSGLNPDQVPPVPGEFHRHPNDWEFYFLGQLEGEPVPPLDVTPARALETEYPARVAPAEQEEDLAFRGPWGPGSMQEVPPAAAEQ